MIVLLFVTLSVVESLAPDDDDAAGAADESPDPADALFPPAPDMASHDHFTHRNRFTAVKQ